MIVKFKLGCVFDFSTVVHLRIEKKSSHYQSQTLVTKIKDCLSSVENIMDGTPLKILCLSDHELMMKTPPGRHHQGLANNQRISPCSTSCTHREMLMREVVVIMPISTEMDEIQKFVHFLNEPCLAALIENLIKTLSNGLLESHQDCTW